MVAASRVLRLAVPLAAAATATGYLIGTEDGHKRCTKVAFAAERVFPLRAPGLGDEPIKKWDWNWDSCQPESLVDPVAYNNATEADRQLMLTRLKPKTTRHLLLIRHGQYHYDGDKCLTKLGREQAALVGARLAASGITFDRLVLSPMVRAAETAAVVRDALPASLPAVVDAMLEEGAPCPPEPPLAEWTPQPKGARIEAAFRKYVHRADAADDVAGKTATYDVIVCHGNVIRYFVCRALQFPPEGWLRLSLANSSITYLVIRPNGRVVLKSMGDCGHLTKEQLSFA